MVHWIGLFIGALAATFLVSRIFMAILRRWVAGNTLPILANALSLVTVTVIAGFGFADGRGFVPLQVLPVYGTAQLAILLLDFWRQTRKPQTADAAPVGKDD